MALEKIRIGEPQAGSPGPNWRKDVEYGVFPPTKKVPAVPAERMLNRVIPCIISRLNHNISQISDTIVDTLTADPLNRPAAFINQVKAGIKQRQDFNEERMRQIKDNMRIH